MIFWWMIGIEDSYRQGGSGIIFQKSWITIFVQVSQFQVNCAENYLGIQNAPEVIVAK